MWVGVSLYTDFYISTETVIYLLSMNNSHEGYKSIFFVFSNNLLPFGDTNKSTWRGLAS